MKPQNSFRLLFVICLLAQACLAPSGEPAGAGLKSYPQLLSGFDPGLTPVQIVSGSEIVTVKTEGKGSLELTADGRRILRLRGTPYEMGFQQGRLLANEVRRMTATVLQTVGLFETLRS